MILFVSLTCWLAACKQSNNSAGMQKKLDSLERRVADSYKPGFGEFMSNIQVHHAKLWFAGKNQNWQLADFEVHEIMEALENIQKYQTERQESKMIPMLNPALDSVNNAIKEKNVMLFNNSFILLTKTCNDCHNAANFGFNVVTIPVSPPFSNQDFKVSR